MYILGSSFRPVRYYCWTCGRHYKHRKSLNQHQRIECGQPPRQKCCLCEKSFHQRGNLTKHLRVKHNVIISQ